MLHAIGLGISRPHLRSAHRLSWRRATSCCRTIRTKCASGRASACPDACRAYGIEGWERIDKESISRDIGEGRWRDYGQRSRLRLLRRGRAQIGAAIARAIARPPRLAGRQRRARAALVELQRQGDRADSSHAACRSTCSCGIWCRSNKAAVIGELLRQFDPSYGSDDPIYTPEGEWSYARFENWLVSAGVTAWPRLESGQLDIDGDAFRLMYHVPGIENLHALRDSLGVIVRAKLPIGRDGRNRPSLFPFGTATGRNAHAKSLFNAHAGMRRFMVFPPDTIGVYLDWRTQEVGVAAALSGDEALMRDYSGGDVYYALAKLCGLTDDPDLKHWKDEQPAMRQRMKTLQLGINYGMGVPSLAKGLDRHPLIASAIIERHKRDVSALLAVARQRGAARHARSADGDGLRLAALHQPQPEPAHALQFPDAGQRRRDAAAGGVAAVRGRHHPEHAGARRRAARSATARSRSRTPSRS